MSNPTTTIVGIRELDCSAEEQILRRVLGSLAGVTSLTFDIVNRRLTVEHDAELVSTQTIEAKIKSAGMTPTIANASSRNESADGEGSCGTEACKPTLPNAEIEPVATRRELVLLGISAALAAGSEATAWITAHEQSWPVISTAVAAILLGGLPTLRKGFIAVKTLTLNINFLMTVAVIGACIIGSWPEAAMVVVLFAIAELIEKYSLDRARNAIRALMEVAPATAWVKEEGSQGSFVELAVGDVVTGSIIRVRPGERLPLDGIVVTGASAVNQAPITGESVSVDKKTGDEVFAGTINEDGLLEVRTTGGQDQTTIARIIRTVQEAQGQRAPTQRFVDRFARIYTPAVFVFALLVAVVPPLLFHQPWHRWTYEALVLLVIACPCALVISTPVSIVSGLAAAAKQGLLIKGGVYLEEGRKLRVIALDKTGTVTEGKPKVTDTRSLGTLSTDQILRLAASLDAGSDHPVARAVTGAWDEKQVQQFGPLLRAADFASVSGRGVTGTVEDKHYWLGNHRFAHERGVCSPAVESVLAELESKGQTAVVLTDEKSALGIIAVADTPRASSVEAIRELHALGLRTIMLSGDNQTTAQTIARGVGIDDARGELLPNDKLTAIDDLLKTYGDSGVGMVGDGVNDAPALAKASIGFAMGAAGTDTALETADVALMQDDLHGVASFIRLSQRTAAVLRQNIAFAIGVKVVFFALALAGVATLWMAVIADVGASLVVVFNGLRLTRSWAGQ